MKKILSNAIVYILPSNIVNIDNRCQYRLLSENQNADKNLRKAELQEKLKSWLESNTSSGHKVDSRSQVIAVPIRVHNTLAGSIKKPTALEFNRDHALFVADEVSHAIFQMNVESNGITITASIISKVDCPSQTYGIAPLDDHVYISSSIIVINFQAASYHLSTTEINNASLNPALLPSCY